MKTPEDRVLPLNDRPRRAGDYVLYWMTAARRTRWSFGLQRAREEADRLGRPLLVLEALRLDYPWASPRLHRFILQGMADNARAFEAAGVTALSYVEPSAGAGRGLLAALAARACVVVTDHYPCFFLPRMARRAAERAEVRFEAVDGNGIYPLRAADRGFTTAASFRRHLQKTLRPHLEAFPVPDPLSGYGGGPAPVDASIPARWPTATPAQLSSAELLASLPLRGPAPVATTGGPVAAGRALDRFLSERLLAYGEGRNHPDSDASSGLSPWLHFGHISVHEILSSLFERDGWSPDLLAPKANGSREGWWGLSAEAESFVDELITWRELGYVFCDQHPDTYAEYDALPEWALRTLDEHAEDPRPTLYSLEQLDGAETHDRIWNAAQRQLRREGRMHNYLRMLWGKKILEWSPTPREAMAVMIELNNRYALDGRDPNSYSGIAWVLGRFDRAWGPERLIFGKIRFMSSDSTARKLKLTRYLARYGAPASSRTP